MTPYLRTKYNEFLFQSRQRHVFAGRNGFVRFGPRHIPMIEPYLGVMPYVGIVALVMHPTFAHIFNPNLSFVYAAVTTALLLPACRRVLLTPAIAMLFVAVVIGVYHKSTHVLATAVAAYAVFWLITYDSKRFYRVFLGINVIAGVVALLQFLIPSELLNFHATAQSLNRFIDQYRPTSIFFAQVLYAQLLLMSLAVFLLVEERRGIVWALFGGAAALTGSTAGLFYVGFSLLMGFKGKGHYSAVGYIGVLLLMLIFYPERVAYNFSVYDLTNSVMTRVSPPADIAPGLVGVTANGHPTLSIAIEVLAITGVMFMAMAALRAAVPIAQLLYFGSAFTALVTGQMLHLTVGSLYFSLYFAAIAALQWKLVQTYCRHSRRPQSALVGRIDAPGSSIKPV